MTACAGTWDAPFDSASFNGTAADRTSGDLREAFESCGELLRARENDVLASDALEATSIALGVVAAATGTVLVSLAASDLYEPDKSEDASAHLVVVPDERDTHMNQAAAVVSIGGGGAATLLATLRLVLGVETRAAAARAEIARVRPVWDRATLTLRRHRAEAMKSTQSAIDELGQAATELSTACPKVH